MVLIQLIIMLLSFDENAGIFVDNHPVQYEYIVCLADPQALWFEDGSAHCWR